MNHKNFMARKSLGEYISAVSAIVSLIILIIYTVYASGLNNINGIIILYLILVIACNVGYFILDLEMPIDVAGIIEIAGTVLTALALVAFFRDSINKLADLLNDITLFSGGVGNVKMIFGIMAGMLILGIMQIVVCFMKKNKEAAVSKE